MVRQKNRWLLVKFDFEEDILSACSPGGTGAGAAASPTTPFSGRKRKLPAASSGSTLGDAPSSHATKIRQVTATDIYRSIQESILQNFGLVGAPTTDVHVRLYDPNVRLAIVKTSRDKYPLVRSAITFLTAIKQGGEALRVVASTIAASGSARTARNAAWGHVQKAFYGRDRASLGIRTGEPWTKKSRMAMEKELRELEDRLEKIDSGC